MSKQCNGTENKKFNENLITIGCISFDTIKDENNVNERGFCEKHLKQVKETQKLMHKNYINKEKIIIGLNKEIRTCLCDELKETGKLITAYYKILEFIEKEE